MRSVRATRRSVGKGSAEADTVAGLVAGVAPLLPVVAGFAGRAGVDRDVGSPVRQRVGCLWWWLRGGVPRLS